MPTVRGVQGRDLSSTEGAEIPARNVFALCYIARDDPVIITNVVVVATVSVGYSSPILISEFIRRPEEEGGGNVHFLIIYFFRLSHGHFQDIRSLLRIENTHHCH